MLLLLLLLLANELTLITIELLFKLGFTEIPAERSQAARCTRWARFVCGLLASCLFLQEQLLNASRTNAPNSRLTSSLARPIAP